MNTETEKTARTPEDVLNELRALVREAESIIGQAPEGACKCEATLAALREQIEAAQERVADLYEQGRRKVVATARRADDTVRDNPYQSIAVALGVGLLAGALLGRRGRSPSP